MSLITLSPQSPNSSGICEIDTEGASIARLKLNGVEIIWSGTRPDGGKGITHPCIPNFNIADGLPNHGPARKAEWTQLNDNTFSWSMEAIPPIYPAGLETTRTFILSDDSLQVTTIIVNNSTQDLPLNIAEHHYFSCPSALRDQVHVNGTPFDHNGLLGNAKYLPINGNELRIQIPNQPMIVMTVTGYTAFAQWSQPDAPFVCVEPIQVMPLESEKFMSEAPKVQAGETKAFEWELRVS